MKIRKSMIGATLLACTLAACDRAPADSAGTAENSEAPPEKAMIADETTPAGAMKGPETLAERRELRMKLAGQQADKAGGLESVASDDAELIDGEVPAEILNKIIDDLAARITAERTDIKVLRAESLTWNDGSLGCGQPGQVYTQALVPGYHIILDHAGQAFDYRATEKGYFMLCERPTISRPGAGGDSPTQ